MTSRRRFGLGRSDRPGEDNPTFTRQTNQSPIHTPISSNMVGLEDQLPGRQLSIGSTNRKVELD